MLEALGAEVILAPQVDGAPGPVTGADVTAAAEVAQWLAKEKGGFYVNQFHARFAGASENTGREIWEQSGGQIDAWVASVGTGATFLGVADTLRERNPSIVCAAVEPTGCQPHAGLPVTKSRPRILNVGLTTARGPARHVLRLSPGPGRGSGVRAVASRDRHLQTIPAHRKERWPWLPATSIEAA